VEQRIIHLHSSKGSPMKYSPGTLVKNLGPNSRAKLFFSPHGTVGYRREVGLLTGTGIILDHHGSDVRIFSNGITGWCYEGNIKVVE
jgi:hypothetical protein